MAALTEPATPLPGSHLAPGDRPSISTGSRWLVVCGLIAAPTVIAFFTGGALPGAQEWAAIIAWIAVALAALTWRLPLLPATAAGRGALAALAGLAAWVALSSQWSTLAGPALADRVRLVLYVAVFLLACQAWPSRRALRALEPGLAVGAVVVVGYSLSGRLLPDVIELSMSTGAGGLLEQPVTYWNALGVIAGVGIVLMARLLGDATRPAALRVAAGAAAPLLTAGLVLTASRGAEAATIGGLLVLITLEPRGGQVRALLVTGAGGLAGVAATVPFSAVRALEGGSAASQGLMSLAALAFACAVTGVVARRVVVARSDAPGGPLRLPGQRYAPVLVCLVIVAAVVGAAAIDKGSRPASGPGSGSTAVKISGNRTDYWTVAGRAFVDHPLKGVGTGSFATEWARERPIQESVRDAHSLYIETGAELGLVGLLLLLAFATATTASAVQARRRDPQLSAGLCAALLTLAVHAGVDWDWEVPAVSLITLVVAGALIAAAGRPPADSAPARG